MRESRSAVITHHVRAALQHSGLSERVYACAVADSYRERTPLHARSVEFHAGGCYDADARSNAQLLRRMLDGQVRMPIDLEEPLVLSLPEPFRGACLRELAARTGHLAAPLPAATGAGQVRSASRLMAETAEAIEALAPLLDDGRIDGADRAAIPTALRELLDVEAACASLRATLQAVLQGASVTSLRPTPDGEPKCA